MKTAAAEKLINLARLEQKMDDAGLDAVVARTGINFTYLAGFAYPGTLARHLDLADSPRGVFVIWPRHGEPVIVTNAIAQGLAQRDSWIERIEVYAGYSEPPVERLAKVLAGMGLVDATVGFEQNFISAADWQSLATTLPRMRMRDSTAIFAICGRCRPLLASPEFQSKSPRRQHAAGITDALCHPFRSRCPAPPPFSRSVSAPVALDAGSAKAAHAPRPGFSWPGDLCRQTGRPLGHEFQHVQQLPGDLDIPLVAGVVERDQDFVG
jgi:hypothetical protein